MYSGDIGKITLVTGDQPVDKHRRLQKVLDAGMATKEIKEILAPLEKSKDPCYILIEGAPGIGKSVLLKEIA